MDAIIGKYRARMEAHGLVLTHPVGICFDLTVDEALGLLEYLQVYRQAVIELQRQEEEERLEHIFRRE